MNQPFQSLRPAAGSAVPEHFGANFGVGSLVVDESEPPALHSLRVVVGFTPEGLCSSLREWWHVQAGSGEAQP